MGLKDGDVVIIQNHRLPGQGAAAGQGPAGFGFNVPPSRASSAAAAPPSSVPQFDFSAIQVPGSSSSRPQSATSGPSSGGQRRPATEDDPAYIRDVLLSSPEQMALVKQNNPELADALLKGDFSKFHLFRYN